MATQNQGSLTNEFTQTIQDTAGNIWGILKDGTKKFLKKAGNWADRELIPDAPFDEYGDRIGAGNITKGNYIRSKHASGSNQAPKYFLTPKQGPSPADRDTMVLVDPWTNDTVPVYKGTDAGHSAEVMNYKVRPSYKQGGLMNYYQYLQQGGGIQDQVAALVQAAMSGDQQATDQINQIMQAAQQGDLKAQQLAQLIQQIAQQLQGQTEEEEAVQGLLAGGSVAGQIFGALASGFGSYLGLAAKVNKELQDERVTKYFNNGKSFGDKDVNAQFAAGAISAINNSKPITPQTSPQNPYQQLPMMKKGGKVKKCACGSKTPKKELGGEFNGTLFQKSKLKKGGCPCQLKRIGGKLIEVDGCTGEPIKNK